MPKTKKNKVLLVEDDEFLSEMYFTKLNLEGFEVFVGHDGDEGLKLAIQILPDIILLDIVMPKKNGFEVLEELKNQDKTKQIPVIILSNLGQKEEIQKGLKLGAESFMIKAHYMPSEVVGIVKEVIKKNQ